MQATYDEALRRLLVHEGGYSNHPSDPGGPTNFGITLTDYRRYINAGGSAADVRNMTVGQAKMIYAARYAKPLRYDDLPAGVDYAIFDYGVNSGISRSAKVLQRLVGVPADGQIGEATIAAVRARNPGQLVEAISDERLRFLKSLRTWPTFGKGWGRRVSEVRAAALVMSRNAVAAPQPTPSVPGKGRVTVPKGSMWTAGATLRDWALAHPFETVAIGAVIVGGVVLVVHAWHHATFDERQDAPTPSTVPVPAQ
jgi:lysozyme family protein